MKGVEVIVSFRCELAMATLSHWKVDVNVDIVEYCRAPGCEGVMVVGCYELKEEEGRRYTPKTKRANSCNNVTFLTQSNLNLNFNFISSHHLCHSITSSTLQSHHRDGRLYVYTHADAQQQPVLVQTLVVSGLFDAKWFGYDHLSPSYASLIAQVWETPCNRNCRRRNCDL